MKGFTKIDNNILFSHDLHPFSKLVLTSLTYYTRNGEGSCFARKATLSRMIGISLYHLRNSLRELEAKDLIHIVRPGQGKPDTIYLNDFKPASKTSSPLPSIIEEELKIEEEETITAEAVKETTENDPILDQQTTPAIRSNPKHLQTTAQPDEPISQLDRDYQQLLEDINRKREARGLEPYKRITDTLNENGTLFPKEDLEDAKEENDRHQRITRRPARRDTSPAGQGQHRRGGQRSDTSQGGGEVLLQGQG